MCVHAPLYQPNIRYTYRKKEITTLYSRKLRMSFFLIVFVIAGMKYI